MNREHRKHVETIRLIITEIIMVLAIIVTAIVLTFLAMGYNLNKDGELGQSGLVQLRSFPSGASITIDGETVLPKTTASRMLTAGEHTIKLTKEGYDSWEKTVTSESGRLLKLEYMRLFYQNRVPEEMKGYEGELVFFEGAPNRDYAMLALKNSNVWRYLDLRGDDVKETELDFGELMKGLEVQEATWNGDSDKMLVKVLHGNETEWVLVNVKNPKESVNLTKEYAMNFFDVRFMSENGEKLAVLENGNLRTIMTSGKTVSQVLASNVKKYSFTGDTLVYVDTAQKVGLVKGDAMVTIIDDGKMNELINVVASDYIGDKYLTVIRDDKMVVYKGELPSADRNLSEMEIVLNEEIDFIPSELGVYGNNELIMARDGKKIAVFDCEARKLSQFELDVDRFFFIDGYMIGEIKDGQLFVMDFDGTNKRHLTAANSAALVTRNNKWLYYLHAGGADSASISLYREKIVE